MKLRISSAAPINSTTASAISVVTSSARVLLCRKPVPLRLLLSFSVLLKSARDDCRAGTSPNRMPVRIDTASVNPKTRQSRLTLEPPGPMRGMLPGLRLRMARMPA